MLALGVADHAVAGWSITCGPWVATTEAGARATFETQIPPYTHAADYRREGRVSGTDDYVFFHSPGDFGGVGIVSFATGNLVFSGSLSWSSLGSRIYPKTLRPAEELPLVCPSTTGDWVEVVFDGVPLDPAERTAFLDVAARTPLRTMLARSHGITHTMLVPYPSDGTYGDPGKKSQSQMLVLFDSALLD